MGRLELTVLPAGWSLWLGRGFSNFGVFFPKTLLGLGSRLGFGVWGKAVLAAPAPGGSQGGWMGIACGLDLGRQKSSKFAILRPFVFHFGSKTEGGPTF